MLKIDLDLNDVFSGLTKGDVARMTRSVANRVRTAVKGATPVDRGGHKRGWSPVKKAEGGYTFGNRGPAIVPLEYGSMPGKRPWMSKGPRTVYHGGKIYSSQAPGGMFETANVEQVAYDAITELLDRLLAKRGVKTVES